MDSTAAAAAAAAAAAVATAAAAAAAVIAVIAAAGRVAEQGYAWAALVARMKSDITERARLVLEDLFQRGERIKGNKASAMQMEEKLDALGVEHRADRFACQNWLSARLKQKADATDPTKVRLRAEEQVRVRLHTAAWDFSPTAPSFTILLICTALEEAGKCGTKTQSPQSPPVVDAGVLLIV